MTPVRSCGLGTFDKVSADSARRSGIAVSFGLMNRLSRRMLRLRTSRALTVLTVIIAALMGAFYGALFAAQQGWGAGDPVCTSGPPPFPMPTCEVPFEASGFALATSALVGALLLAGLALVGLALIRRLNL